MTPADIIVKSLPPIDIVDSRWVVFAAWTSFLVGIGTIALAYVTWRLSRATVRASGLEFLREQRAARPIVIAFIDPHAEDEDETREPYLYRLKIQNKGAVALFVSVFGHSERGNSLEETNTIQVLSPSETASTPITILGENDYAQQVRIRYKDVFGNRYMTEYKSLGVKLTYPIFRLPWLGKEVGEAPPSSCSDKVTWDLKHFERQSDVSAEPTDSSVAPA